MTLPHGGNIYHFSRICGIPVEDMVDFSASINPLGPSPAAVRAIKDSIGLIDSYPDPDCAALKAALSEYIGVPESAIMPANGSTELIYLLARTLGKGRVVVMSPGFSDYERAASVSGAKVMRIPLRERAGFLPDIGRIAAALSRSDLLYYCNPNNPTGVVVDRSSVLGLLKAARAAGAFVVLDEAFVEYCPDVSIAREAAGMDGAAVIRNFTKFFALPGLRAGYMVASPKIVERLRKCQEPWSVNALAQAAACASLTDAAYISKSRVIMEKERAFLFKGLSGIPGLKPYASSANFILVRLTAGAFASQLAERLAEKGVLIRDCSNFRGLDGSYIRVAVRRRSENMRLLGLIKPALHFTGR